MATEPSGKTKREKNVRPLDEEARPCAENVVQPADDKIPEGPGNLRRRAEWFQKRSGGKQ